MVRLATERIRQEVEGDWVRAWGVGGGHGDRN